jgi:peptide/nickel transport system substrate-binding protein
MSLSPSRLLPVVLALTIAACAPAVPTPAGGSANTGEATTARKVLSIAARQELASFGDFTGQGSSGGGNASIRRIAHDYLAVPNDEGTFVAQLALELPSVDRGTWTVNADGSMDTTWKLRPGVTWQDGQPFSADDVVFAFALHSDRDFTLSANGAKVRLIDDVTAPDPSTVVVHWRSTVPDADRAYGLDPMPRHLLEETYRTDKQALINSPLLSSGFVGLGPYRVARWEEGVELQFDRYDPYYLGRPPLDSVIVRYIKDGNTMVANALAGTVDVVIPPSIDLEQAADVRTRWAGTGNRVEAQVTQRLRWLRPQFRPDFAAVKAGLTNQTVRRAFFHAVDRGTLAEVVGQGIAPVADSWIGPREALRPQVASAIPQYPYDPSRAAQLLGEAGWTRGADGALVHQPDGERFESVISVRPTTGADKDAAIITDGWKAIGAQIGIYLMPASLADDREHLSSQPMVTLSSNPSQDFYNVALIHSAAMATPANRWNGQNNQGYSNARVDDLINRLLVTIEPAQQASLQRELLQEALNDVALIPLYWQTDPLLLLAPVRTFSWHTFDWDKS